MLPVFDPVPVVALPGYTLYDLRTLMLDPGDLNSPGMVCYGNLYTVWNETFGTNTVQTEVGEVEVPVDHPGSGDEILFAIQRDADELIIGAGALHNLEITSATAELVEILCDVIVTASIQALIDIISETAEGFTITSSQPGAPDVTIHLR